MKNLFGYLLLLVLGTSCIYDYDISGHNNKYTPKIVINGIITESDSNTFFFARSVPDFNTNPGPVTNARFIVMENGKVVIDSFFISLDKLTVNHKFRQGPEYKIFLKTNNEEVSATTTIPSCHFFKTDTMRNIQNNPLLMNKFWNVKVYFQEISDKNNFLIKSTIYDHLWRKVDLYDIEYNGKIPYADDINMEITLGVENSTYYNGFVRISNKNLMIIKDAITFNFDNVYRGKYIVMDFMTVPEGYDRYFRSCYEFKKQYSEVYDFPGITNSAVPVYNNIHGGIGIFDGISKQQIIFENPYYQAINE